jgi:hypothetical protein
MTPKKRISKGDSNWKSIETPDELKATSREIDEYDLIRLSELDPDESGKRRSRLDELDKEPE